MGKIGMGSETTQSRRNLIGKCPLRKIFSVQGFAIEFFF